MSILEEIISYKKLDVSRLKDHIGLEEMKKKSFQRKVDPFSFSNALLNKIKNKQIALIAEVKKGSPSKGIIKKDFNHIEIAKAYKAGGATCLSVLTDEKYFLGDKKYIGDIKSIECWNLPILRKDFIVDKYQIYESICLKADCILIIAAALEKNDLKKLFLTAIENNLDTIIEVHNEKEMETALSISDGVKLNTIIGINNRDLNTFITDLSITKKLVNKYRRDLENKIIISESGISSKNEIQELSILGVYSYLIGESLIKEENIEEATRKLVV